MSTARESHGSQPWEEVKDGALDPAGLLAILAGCGVDFVVIGAMAVGVHAEVRSTGDVDIMVPVGDAENKRSLEEALKRLGAVRLPTDRGGVDTSPDDPYPTVMFTTRCGKLDVLYRPDGSDRFSNVKRRAVQASIGGRLVSVAGKDDLVRMKLAAGRPDDLRDVANLTAAEQGGSRSRRVRAAMTLAPDVDVSWAIDLAAARVGLFDRASRVSAQDGLLRIEAARSDLTDAQIEQWAQALAGRLLGAGVLADSETAVVIETVGEP